MVLGCYLQIWKWIILFLAVKVVETPTTTSEPLVGHVTDPVPPTPQPPQWNAILADSGSREEINMTTKQPSPNLNFTVDEVSGRVIVHTVLGSYSVTVEEAKQAASQLSAIGKKTR